MITRALQHNALKNMLKRCCNVILGDNAVIRGVQNMGATELPNRVKSHHRTHTHGHYFLWDIHAPASTMNLIRRELGFEEDMIRDTWHNKDKLTETMEYVPKIWQC